MLKNVTNLWKKKLSKTELIDYVMGMPEHSWMSQDQYLKANMLDFLERLPLRVLDKVFMEKATVFAPSTGRYACSVSNVHRSVVIIFPEVYQLLTKTYDGWAKAVLAHELGHVYLDHTANMDDPMEAQVDADNFAMDMGYLEELESFLYDQPESVEKRVRISFVTSYYFSNH